MKLSELLEVIPDNCKIGLADFSEFGCKIPFGNNHEEVIKSFAEHKKFIPEQVENLEVIAIHPGTSAYLPSNVHTYGEDNVHTYGEDIVDFYIKTHLLIEITCEKEEE